MEDLIKALQIMLKYENPKYPTICDFDILYITDKINPDKISYDDLNELIKLGFFVYCDCGKTEEQFCECEGKQLASYKFGSA